MIIAAESQIRFVFLTKEITHHGHRKWFFLLHFCHRYDQLQSKCLENSEHRYQFVYKPLHLCYSIVVCFNLIPALAIFFELPFYLFWMLFAIDDIVSLLYLWYVVHPNCNTAVYQCTIKYQEDVLNQVEKVTYKNAMDESKQ